MQIHHSATAGDLADRLVSLWSGPRVDPFAFDLAVVPGPGFQRWLSQRLATAGEVPGICAGVEFVTASRLARRLGLPEDRWQPERLSRTIQQVVLGPECPPGLATLRAHLDASRETWTATGRIARHFASYARHLPDMLADWRSGDNRGPDGRPLGDHEWQAVLWQELVDQLDSDPLTERADLLARLAAGPVEGLPARIAVVDPLQLDPASLELYEGLSAHHQVDLLLLTHSPALHPDGHPLNLSLGALAAANDRLAPAAEAVPVPDHTGTLLGRLQHDLAVDRAPVAGRLAPGDDSVQVHLSHGPSRQVEVLREVLAGLFASDPSLEPRHVAVLTPDPDTYAPLVGAAFTPQPGVAGHPAQTFRLQVADRSAAQVNPLVELLLDLLRLPDSRVEASRLLELCANPPIANRFGFRPDDADRLAELTEHAGVRWGLSAAQRAGYGLGSLQQNTWLAGLQRMLLGVTMSEAGLVTVGTVLPLDDVDSSDIDLIGGLVELVGRLTRWLAEIGRPGSLVEWVERCRDVMEALVAVPAMQEWQLADLLSGLRRLADFDVDDHVQLSRHAAIRAISDEFRGSPARGTFGNGSLLVASPASLRDVPHRVVVLLGWDAGRYPRSARRHGDDLVGLVPVAGAGSAALADRQALLDAVHAASDKLILVLRGRSESTNQPVPPAAPIAELLDALDATASTPDGTPAGEAVSFQHPLQPFEPAYFLAGSPVRSHDPLAWRAAEATRGVPGPQRDRYRLDPLPFPDLTQGVGLDELTDFFRHPARALLKTRTGLSLGEDDPADDSIPIEPDGLARWQVGNRVLHALQAGLDDASVERAERLRGQVPPAALGTRMMGRILAEAHQTLAVRAPTGEHRHHDVDLIVPVPGHGDVTLTGRVSTVGGVVWQAEYSGLQPRHRLAVWLRLLAVAATGSATQAHVVGKGRQVRYLAPEPAVALDLLGRYLAIRAVGLTRPLPALTRLTEFWAQCRASARDPLDPFRRELRERLWKWEKDAAWQTFFTLEDALAEPVGAVVVDGADPAEATLLGALASAIWTPMLAAEVAP